MYMYFRGTISTESDMQCAFWSLGNNDTDVYVINNVIIDVDRNIYNTDTINENTPKVVN